MSFIDQIKYKMIEKHITEKQLSDMIGCSETLLNGWLEGLEEMPIIISKNITKVLELDKEKEEKNIIDRYNKLSNENKNKVLEYIEFLQYKEKKLLKKTNNS